MKLRMTDLIVSMVSVVMLRDIFSYSYGECLYAQCHYAQCHVPDVEPLILSTRCTIDVQTIHRILYLYSLKMQ